MSAFSRVSHPTSATVFRLLFLSQLLCTLSSCAPTVAQNPTSATALSYPRIHVPPHHLLPPPYFRLFLLPTHPRVSPAHFLRTPRILRVTRLGPPEKVGNVNRVHGNRARPNLRSFTPLLLKPLFPHLSPSILLSRHTTTPCPHHLSAITRT